MTMARVFTVLSVSRQASVLDAAFARRPLDAALETAVEALNERHEWGTGKLHRNKLRLTYSI